MRGYGHAAEAHMLRVNDYGGRNIEIREQIDFKQMGENQVDVAGFASTAVHSGYEVV